MNSSYSRKKTVNTSVHRHAVGVGAAGKLDEDADPPERPVRVFCRARSASGRRAKISALMIGGAANTGEPPRSMLWWGGEAERRTE